MAEGIRGVALENHFASFEHGALGDDDGGVAAGILAAVGDHKLGELLNIEFVFGDDAAVGGSRHSWEHSGETCVAPENLEDHEAFVRARSGAQAVGQMNRARHASAETDAVIGARNVVVHSLGDADHFEAFLVEADGVAERVVPSDGDEVVNAEPGEIFQDLGSEVILGSVVSVLKMRGDAGLADAGGIGARRMQKSASGASGTIDDFLRERQEIVAIIVALVANHFDQPGPSVANADDGVTFAQRTESDGADGGVQSGNISAPGEDADDAFLCIDVGQDAESFLGEANHNYP
jgi:hypothetical protein